MTSTYGHFFGEKIIDLSLAIMVLKDGFERFASHFTGFAGGY
jgi:hypothetical protein